MFIWTQFINQLPVGLLAQLVESCTGIAEVMGFSFKNDDASSTSTKCLELRKHPVIRPNL